MKRTMKTMLFFFAAALVMVSCSEDPNPPVAGFSLSNETPVQWDKSTIASTATGAVETDYTVTGGEFEWADEATIQFLEAKTYTVTQTASNADGSTETSMEVVVTAPDNTYKMSYYGESELTIVGDAYWAIDGMTQANQIWVQGEGESTQETNNTLKAGPDLGLDALHGEGTRSYTYSADGGSGTYIGDFTHYPETGADWDHAWMFATTAGEGLEITLIYAPEGATDETGYVYDITMSNTTLNDYYENGSWSPTTATSTYSFKYRGMITPL
jgi:hypothetical protein